MKMQIAKLLKNKKHQILEYWMAQQMGEAGLREDLISSDELTEQSAGLLEAFLSSITDDNLSEVDSPQFESLHETLAGITISRARQGFSPRETGMFVFSLKEALLETLQQELNDNTAALIEVTLKLNRFLDTLGIISFETFIRGREEVVLRQSHEISEISTPVIRIWDGILALPIIGTLDSSRTQTLMESLLQEIVESNSTIAILDISGVPAVDSMVAQHLIKTVTATRLMGAECIISGIRPEIAQTIVHLGIDLSGVATKATLASALQHAFRILNLEVRKTQKEKAL